MRQAELLRYLILAAQREGNRLLADGLRPLGVTPSQAEALRVLQEHGPMTLKDVGAHLVCETGSPSRLLSTLVDAGLVQRDQQPDDARAVRLGLTPGGAARAAQIKRVESQLYDDIERRTQGLDVTAVLEVLRSLVADRPAGRSVDRRATGATNAKDGPRR